jgi:ornithine racemase
MNRVTINLEALRHNFRHINGLMERMGASWSVVTKALCGHEETIAALHVLGARSVADSRLDNLRAIHRAAPDMERWYLRLPHLSAVEKIVELSDVSLNTEIEVIAALSKEAVRQDKTHHVIIMIELGDLREGILPGSLVRFYQDVFELPNINVMGIGAQIGCLAGAIPNVDQVAQLLLYRELLELKFDRKIPIVSAGSSVFLSLILDGRMPKGVNHYRIGEALFLGTDLVTGGRLPELRDDVVCLEAEIAEIKEKSLVATGETGTSAPFDSIPPPASDVPAHAPGQRGYRALVTVGQLDTDVGGLTPLNGNYQVAGASSDITVINLGDSPDGLQVGDTIKFQTNYSAFVRLMSDPYIDKEVHPSLEVFRQEIPDHWNIEVPPTLPQHESESVE